MRGYIFSLLVLLVGAKMMVAFPQINYKSIRNQILEYEKRMMLGAKLTLNAVEEAANRVLMKAKRKELEAAFEDPRSFPPSRNFLVAKEDIEQSEVFKLIKQMPKGAVLHAHDTSIVTADFIYHNITFRENLYICEGNDKLRLRFFDRPSNDCDWKSLRDVRRHPTRAADVNKRIMDGLSMVCDDPVETYSDVNTAWNKFIDIFAFVNPILTYKPVYEDHFLRGLEELLEDNVMYLELRSTMPTLYDFDGTQYKPQDLAGIYQKLTQRFKEEHPEFVGAKLIYAPVRSADRKEAKKYVNVLKKLQELYPTFIAGFDLVGQEDKGETLEYFSDILSKINTSFFFHAGETNWYGASTDENLVDAILLNTKRIGHGYALNSHPFLLEVIKGMNIAIEVNPISNQVLKLTDDLRNHPARRLFAEGYPVVISNDDPGFWGARALSYDFYQAFMALMSEHADLRALKQLAMNSLNYSSLSREEKEKALAIWREKWDDFVWKVAGNEY